MIRAILISPVQAMIQQLESALSATRQPIELVKEYTRYPTTEELVRVLDGLAPNVVFLDLSNETAASRIMEAISGQASAPLLVALHHSTTALMQAMRNGIRDYLTAPFDQPAVDSCIQLLRGLIESGGVRQPAPPATKMIAFLPAKPGCGASTIALNTCAALSAAQRTLLVDADPFNGQLAYMLKQDNSFSIRHALDRAGALDEDLWDKMVRTFGRLDVLSGEDYLGDHAPSAAPLRRVLDFARAYYDAIACDLPGALDDAAQCVLQQSGKIVLAVTPDVASLRLAYCKLHLLDGLGCAKRVQLVLNRTHARAGFRRGDVERSLGMPVVCEIPANHSAVHNALVEGRPVREYAARFGALAGLLVGRTAEPPKERYRRRFLQFFSIGRAVTAPLALLGDGKR